MSYKAQSADISNAMVNNWDWDLTKAPHNKRILVQASGLDYYATFDPTWGKGRGAWFTDKNTVLTNVWCWREDVDFYVENRDQGPHIIPIK